MKRRLAFLLLFMMLASISAFAEDKPQQKTEAEAQETAPVKKKFIIRLKDGGSMETNNYTYEGGKVKVYLPTGSISLDRSMVLRIDEVKGDEGEPIQKIFRLPEEKHGAKAPPAGQRPAEPVPPAQSKTTPSMPSDNNGHTELWWKAHVKDWKKKLADAQERYDKAQQDWNKYNGLVNSVGSGASAYQVTQYQDMRGSARVEMDKAQADMDEAKRMLEVVLPDEARQAGAPPGWAR